MWVALVEKAWATDKGNDYANLESPILNPFSEVGNPYYPLGQIGGTNRNMYPGQQRGESAGRHRG